MAKGLGNLFDIPISSSTESRLYSNQSSINKHKKPFLNHKFEVPLSTTKKSSGLKTVPKQSKTRGLYCY